MQRAMDGYIHVTPLCQAAGTRINNYLISEPTNAFLRARGADARINVSERIQIVKGGFPELQGTCVHSHVANHLGPWLSPQFAVRVSSIVENWMSGLPRHRAMERVLLSDPADWTKRFPDELYREIYWLKGWTWHGMGLNRYRDVGKSHQSHHLG